LPLTAMHFISKIRNTQFLPTLFMIPMPVMTGGMMNPMMPASMMPMLGMAVMSDESQHDADRNVSGCSGFFPLAPVSAIGHSDVSQAVASRYMPRRGYRPPRPGVPS
jgi:hypothetical protein